MSDLLRIGDFQPKSGRDEPSPEVEPLEPGVWEKLQGRVPAGTGAGTGLCSRI